MVRARLGFVCQECGAQAPKWSGRCAECGAWNALVEGSTESPGAPGGGRGAGSPDSRVHDADAVEVAQQSHLPTGMGELDRVLGGGLVPGSVVLIGGDPGIGKSTLLLQLLAAVAAAGTGRPLYVTGEESLRQVVLRARRLKVATAGLRLLAETAVERILDLAQSEGPSLLVVDSVQTVHSADLASAPGSVAQVRECAARLSRYAKARGVTLILVGHVTKEGALAGPRVLEHMVDAVLYFESESESGGRFRLIRAVKNRFGAANEIGIFAMTERGLREVGSPSAIFLSREGPEAPGSVVTVTRQGTRPLLVELQALVDVAQGAHPRRVSVGLDANRLSLLLAVLHRHAGIDAHDQDVYLNVVGGVRLGETGADLPALMAVASSLRGRPVPRALVAFGEVGLTGEVRPVYNGEERLLEAAKHGFTRAVVPRGNLPRRAVPGMEVSGVQRVAEALDRL